MDNCQNMRIKVKNYPLYIFLIKILSRNQQEKIAETNIKVLGVRTVMSVMVNTMIKVMAVYISQEKKARGEIQEMGTIQRETQNG